MNKRNKAHDLISLFHQASIMKVRLITRQGKLSTWILLLFVEAPDVTLIEAQWWQETQLSSHHSKWRKRDQSILGMGHSGWTICTKGSTAYIYVFLLFCRRWELCFDICILDNLFHFMFKKENGLLSLTIAFFSLPAEELQKLALPHTSDLPSHFSAS